VVLQWSKEEDEVLAQVTLTALSIITGIDPVPRPLQSMVRNGTKFKRLCHSGDIIKSGSDG